MSRVVIALGIYLSTGFTVVGALEICSVVTEAKKRVFFRLENGEQVRQVGVGDILYFDRRHVFEVRKLLSQGRPGTRHTVFGVGNGIALRVAKNPTTSMQVDLSFYRGQRLAKSYGVPIVEVYRFSPGKFTTVEELNIRFDADTYFRSERAKLGEAENKAILNAFLRFAESTYRFEVLGDLAEENLIYTAQGEWKMADVSDEYMALWDGHESMNAFQRSRRSGSFLAVPDDFFLEINRVIARKRHGQSGLSLPMTQAIPFPIDFMIGNSLMLPVD